MPHINRVRLVNVNFNDAKSSYDNFNMRLNGKSTTYDLMNTGGKSLLLLMMLQTVIPNSYLKKEKPIKNIFVGGNTKRTSHCLIEWILDEGYEYKYMLTGFCARKKQDSGDEVEGEENKLDIDYYNYCYFYNNENDYDIRQLPLVEDYGNEKVYMSYDKLRQLLNGLKKDGLPVEIFDSKKEYIKHIEYFGLIGAEWKLISEINVSENYIEKYFKENKTSRKLIENFLIKIIDNVNMQNNEEYAKNENQLADTLIELKENLMEFRRKSDNKNEYLQAKELYNNLQYKNDNIITEFSKVEQLHKKAYEAYVFQNTEKTQLTEKIQNEKNEIDRLTNNNQLLKTNNQKLEIDKLYINRANEEKEKANIEEKIKSVSAEKEQVVRELQIAKSQNEYIDYLEYKNKAKQTQIRIDNLSVSEENDYQKYGYNYKVKLEEKIVQLDEFIKRETDLKTQKEGSIDIAKRSLYDVRDKASSCKANIENVSKDIKDKEIEIEDINKELTTEGKVELLLDLEKSINSQNGLIEQVEKDRTEKLTKIEELAELNKIKENEIFQAKIDKTSLNEKLNIANKEIGKYEEYNKSIISLQKTFGAENIEKLHTSLLDELGKQEKERNAKQIEKQIKEKKLELMIKYDMVVPNEDIFHLKEKLENKCSYVISGIEALTNMDEEKRNEVLSLNPLFVYSLFIDDNTFRKMQNNQLEVDTENLVPIFSVEVLRETYTLDNSDIIFPVQKKAYLNKEEFEKYKQTLENSINTLNADIDKFRQKEDKTKGYLDEVNFFIKNYNEVKVKEIYQNKEKLENEIKHLDTLIDKLKISIEDNIEEIAKLKESIKQAEKQEQELKHELEFLIDLQKLQTKCKNLKEKKSLLEKDYSAFLEIAEEKQEIFDNLLQELDNIKTKLQETAMQKARFKEVLDKLPEFQQTELLDLCFDDIKNNYEALNSSHAELSDLQERIGEYNKNMDKCVGIIKENNCSLEFFEEQANVVWDKVLQSKLNELDLKLKELEYKLKSLIEDVHKKDGAIMEMNGRINTLIEQLGDEYVEENREADIEIIERKIKENTIQLNLNTKSIKVLKDKISYIDKEIEVLEKECDRLEIYVAEKEIAHFDVDVANLLKNEIYEYSKIQKESSKTDKNISNLKDEFANQIRHIKESVDGFYIKQDILDTMQELNIPVNLVECNNIKNGIAMILSLLDEKIRHTDEALKNLEKYQEHFITKCFERAETIVRDLEKLPGLSKIKIGGKDVNIIKLDLFEYEKEEKMNKMKDYIYKIVREMEDNPNEIDKQELNEKLSSRALVSQIVNMDKACVKLYKIEDIQEHSTYKKWEDDLGSDGQVNAIYFMFAVCIISYISMLTRKEASSKSKKVIIVDNPFGATSAVFLWNVMFSILKENNVQLIAPGHNINKEIISKFEVNYVLKHEYHNGNKKTVVVDKELRTEDDLDNMNFNLIEGTQQRMF